MLEKKNENSAEPEILGLNRDEVLTEDLIIPLGAKEPAREDMPGILTETGVPGEVVDHIFEEETQMAAPKKKKKSGKKASKKVLLALLSLLLAVALFAGIWVLFSDYWLKMKDVTVAGIRMEGMTKKEAKDALTNAVNATYAKQNMTVTVLGTTLEIPGAEAGITVDADKAIDKAYYKTGVYNFSSAITTGKGVDKVVDALLKEFNVDLKQTDYKLEGTVPELKTAEAGEGGQTVTVTIGSPKYVLNEKDLRKAILAGYGTANFTVKGECQVTEPEMLSAKELYDKFLTAPVDAVLDKTTWTVTPETYGYSVNEEKAAEAVADLKYGDTFTIPFSKIAPAVTEASIWAELFKDVLGECTTKYSGSDNNNRNTNLRLACEKLDGLILLPGQSFSYNETLGPRTAAGGWKSAGAYSNGETVNVYGGGICQGSTTLYNCVLLADLKVDEARNHSYVSSYIGKGLDATVSWGGPDFRFTNSNSSPIKIEAGRKGGKMTMRIYGIDDKDYYIKMTNKVISTWGYSTEYVTYPAGSGYRDGQVITTPYSGCKAESYKNKYSKATNELIETKLERVSTYKSRNKVVAKVAAPVAPADPPAEG